MKLQPCLVGVALLLALAACRPGAAEYTESEAPKALVLDNATASITVRFLPGSSQLVARDAARLRALAASGGIAPSDNVTVAAAGSPGLAAARFDTIAAELLRYRVIANAGMLGAVPPNRAILATGRYLVTLPPCPNWSKQASLDFTNSVSSNFGCATAVDFGQSVASPTDLAEGRPLGLTDAIPAAAAVQRYEKDAITLPAATALGPVAASGAPAPAAATGAGTAGSQP